MRFYIVARSSIISDYRARFPGLAETKLDFPWIQDFRFFGPKSMTPQPIPERSGDSWRHFRGLAENSFFGKRNSFQLSVEVHQIGTRKQFFRRFCDDGFFGFFDDFSIFIHSKSIFGAVIRLPFSDQPARKFIKFYEVHVVRLFEKNFREDCLIFENYRK